MPKIGKNNSNNNNCDNNINNNLMNRAEWLRQARKGAGLTQRELSELAGIRIATISSIENGHSYRSSTIDKIKAVLKKDLL